MSNREFVGNITDDFEIRIEFSSPLEEKREVRVEFPDIANKKWDFKSSDDKVNLAKLVLNIKNKYICRTDFRINIVNDLVNLFKNEIKKGRIIKIGN
jgi:hypothetical protein